MLVANSFDLWQRDTFFSAAEEVQASADIMESAYRTWVRQRREGVTPLVLDELCRELQTALGTAKWQLDEFERAVRMSYRTRTDEITASRHRQFVTAIGDQISRVEGALREFFNDEGKKPLRWVNLDEKECDDLAMFLSGTPTNSKVIKDDCIELGGKAKGSISDKLSPQKDLGVKRKCSLFDKESPRRDLGFKLNQAKGCKDSRDSMDASHVIDMEPSEVPGTSDDSSCQADKKASTRRTWSPPATGELKIVIPYEDEQEKPLMLGIEATPKEKGYKPSFWKSRVRNGNYPLEKGEMSSYFYSRGNNWISQRGNWKSETATNLLTLAKKSFPPTYTGIDAHYISVCAFCHAFKLSKPLPYVDELYKSKKLSDFLNLKETAAGFLSYQINAYT